MALNQTLQVTYCPALSINYTAAPARDLYFTLERCSDGWFYDPSDNTFKILTSITDPKISLTESPAGEYNYILDVAGFVDGSYNTDIVELVAGVEVEVVSDASIFLVGTNPLIQLGQNLEMVNEDTGGINNLRYVTAAGDPVDDADILVFTKTDYDAGLTNNAVAVSKTDSDGKFLYPVLLQKGDTYIIVFQKPNLYGPDTAQITI